METPTEWEFIKWGREDTAYVFISYSNLLFYQDFQLTLVQPHQNPFYAAILAAHGPVHEPTPEQLAREAEIHAGAFRVKNLQRLQQSVYRVSATADNPSHWNRLNPERKAEILTHYRSVVKLRNHEDLDKRESILNLASVLPTIDFLEDPEGSPHRETNILIAANTTLFRGDILVQKTGDGAVDSHTRNFCGEHATVQNTVMAGNFDMFLATNGIMSDEGLYLDTCLLYTSPSPRDRQKSRMPSSA